jgi:hypothetical protein
MLSHLCDIVPSGAVCTRVLRCNSEYLHGDAGLSNQESNKACLGHQRMLYISVVHLLVSHLCDLDFQVQCAPRVCAATANTCMVSAGHSAIRKQQSLPGSSKECDTSVLHAC